jgi:hypothetical protein
MIVKYVSFEHELENAEFPFDSGSLLTLFSRLLSLSLAVASTVFVILLPRGLLLFGHTLGWIVAVRGC